MSKTILPQNHNIADHAQAINEMQKGKLHNTGTFTLTASASSTTVTNPNCSPGAIVKWSPQTLHAAQEDAGGTMYVPAATVTFGSFVVQHANNAQADRTFGYTITGGN